MKVVYRDIVLRDMIESDIEDWIRWETVDTEWMDWDGPDMPAEQIDPDEYRNDLLEFVKEPREDGFRSFFEIQSSDGQHLGRINSYALDDQYQHMRWPDSGNDFIVAIGIDICDSRFWNRGYGRQAIAGFIQHFEAHGFSRICTQTWSGNHRMISCAQRLGFVECKRTRGDRYIRDEVYDSLTFRLDLDRFRSYLRENP